MYQLQETVSHFSEMEKALLFKMACNQEDQVNSLLSYYRDRINDFDKERCEWLQKLNEVVTTEAEKHKLDWELKRRRDEINSLKETLDGFKSTLYQERQNVLLISRENELLRLKDIDDKKKLAELSSLVEPIEENIVLNKNKKPEVSYAYAKTDGSIHRNKAVFESVLKKVGREGFNEGQAKCVMRNIHLPNDGINLLEKENEVLRIDIQKQRELWMDVLEGLTQKLNDREQLIRHNTGDVSLQIQKMHEKSQNLHKQHLDLTKEMFQIKIQTNERERKQHEENELLRLKNTAIANKLLILEKKANNENNQALDQATKISLNAANQFRNQVRSKEENIQILKEQYNQVQKIYLNKIKQIEQNLTNLNEKYEKVDLKRKVSNFSCKGEIQIIVNKIDTIRRQIQLQDEQNAE